MNENLSIKQLFILLFIGGMVYLFARHRNAAFAVTVGSYPSGTAPTEHDSLSLSLGFIHSIDVPPARAGLRRPLETGTSAIPLAADFLSCDAGYSPATSQYNLDATTSDSASDFQMETQPNESTRSIGVRGPNTIVRQGKFIGVIDCHPCIPMCIPHTGVI